MTGAQRRIILVQKCQELASKGKTNAKIAEELYLNERDVRELLAEKVS